MVIPDGWSINGRWQMGPGACRLLAGHRTVRTQDVGGPEALFASNQAEASHRSQMDRPSLPLLWAAESMRILCHHLGRSHAPALDRKHWLLRPQAVIRRAPCEQNGEPAGSRTPAKLGHRDRHKACSLGFEARVWRGSPWCEGKTCRLYSRTRSSAYAEAFHDTVSAHPYNNIASPFRVEREPSSYKSNSSSGLPLPLCFCSPSCSACEKQRQTIGSSALLGACKRSLFWHHRVCQNGCPYAGATLTWSRPRPTTAGQRRLRESAPQMRQGQTTLTRRWDQSEIRSEYRRRPLHQCMLRIR